MKILKITAGVLIGLIALVQTSISFAATNMLAAATFTDLPMNHAYYDAIMFLEAQGIVSGYPDGTFKPDQVVNRAEALKMIMGINDFNFYNDNKPATISLDEALKIKLPFKDLDQNAWYYQYLQQAFGATLIDGYPDGTYKPDQTVNVVEGLKILLNQTFFAPAGTREAYKQYVIADPFVDALKNQWYSTYVQFAKDYNIIKADSDGKIHPSDGLTRGSLAYMIYRIYITNRQAFDLKGVSAKFDAGVGKFVVYKKGVKFAVLPEDNLPSHDNEAYIQKVTSKNVYVSVCATGFGGYIMYDFCDGNTYRVNLTSGKVDKINTTDSFSGVALTDFMDVSADETTVAWVVNDGDKMHHIMTSNIDATLKGQPSGGSWAVDKKWGQFGSVKFSADGKKLAYAGIIGDPGNEESAVYTIDIATGKQTLITDSKTNIYHVFGWKGDDTVLYNH